ncbi:hypothetical protein [Hansschlegelia sp.]|uniref:hypothetical protein n=1 Tax=Hansschlegelia sp. TaxID=2041892 RepID=UPI002C9D298F|nr:hypothetical protein [Hansschlegelia sp.]HVI30427.1 hypothetical protein [Hansschlegelia sp.]
MPLIVAALIGQAQWGQERSESLKEWTLGAIAPDFNARMHAGFMLAIFVDREYRLQALIPNGCLQ